MRFRFPFYAAFLAVVLPIVAGAQDIQLQSVDVVQQAPGVIHEDFRRGWSLTLSVSGVNPAGSSGGRLYVMVTVPSVVPAANRATLGAGGGSRCVPDPGADQFFSNDVVLDNQHWFDIPGTTGAFANQTLPSVPLPSDDGVDVPFGFSVSFGDLCDDFKAEPDESFTVRVWFSNATAGPNNRLPHGGGGIETDVIIRDYDLEPQAPRLVDARSQLDAQSNNRNEPIRVNWTEPGNADAARVRKYVVELEQPGTTQHSRRATGIQETSLDWPPAGTWSGQGPDGNVHSVRVCASPSDSGHVDGVAFACGPWSAWEVVEFGGSQLEIPEGFAAVTGDNGKVDVSWTGVDDAGGYQIEYWRSGTPQARAETLNVAVHPVSPSFCTATDPNFSCSISSLVFGAEYRFRIRSVKGPTGTSDSLWSSEVRATAGGAPVTTPGPPRRARLALSGSTVSLSWDEPSNHLTVVGDITYDVEYRQDNGSWTRSTSDLIATAWSWTGRAGSMYRARVRAKTGPSTISAWANAGGTVTVPRDGGTSAAPTEVEAFIDPGRNPPAPAVIWEPPLNADSVEVTGYDVQWRDSVNRRWSADHAVGAAVRSHVHTGTSFTAGRTYEARVRARSSTGPGPWASASVEYAEGSVPGPPTAVELRSAGGKLSLSWSEPSGFSASGLSGYKVQWRGPDQVSWSPRTPTVLSNSTTHEDYPNELEPGGAYEARVRAFTPAGDGPWAATSHTVPVPPSAGVPSSVEAFIDPGRNPPAPAVIWEPPLNADSFNVTGYDVQWRDSVNRRWSPDHALGPAVRSHVHTGTSFTAGRTYEARVRARSSTGPGPWASASVEYAEGSVPGPPTAVELRSGGGKLSLSWSEPSGFSVSDLSGYKVQWRGPDQLYWSPRTPTVLPNTAGTAEYPNALDPGGAYEARVRAFTPAGDGPWAATSHTVPVAPSVGVPSSVEAFYDPARKAPAVMWEPPTSTAVVPTGYDVQWRDSVNRRWSNVHPVGGNVRSHVHTGSSFVEGRVYEARVRARPGPGAWSSPASVVFPTHPDVGVPSDVEAFYDVDAAAPALRWAPPVGSPVPVVGYDVRWRDDVNRRWSTVHTLDDVRSHVHTGGSFRPRGTYSAQVRARSSQGSGAWSTEVEVTLPDIALPGQPINVEAFMDARFPAVTWEPPLPVAGVTVTGYEVEFRTAANRVWARVCGTLAPSVRKCRASSATVGQTYEFRVRARSDPGPGPWSPAVSVVVPAKPLPGAPLNVEAFMDRGSPAVVWEPPLAVPGVTVTGYQVQYRTGADRVWRDPACKAADLSLLKCTAPSALVGETYEFRVRALTAGDPGPWSPVVSVTVPRAPLPGVPTAVEAFINLGMPAVTWEPPVPVRGASVTGYKVQYRTSANRVWIDAPGCVSLPATARVCALTSAVPGETYEFRVRALSAAGPGPWSGSVNVQVPAVPVPAAPQGLRLEADGLALVATWDEPVNVEEAPVEGYRLRLRGTGIDDAWRVRNTAASQLRLRITNLPFERGGTYRAQVRALGTGGDGPWSAEAQAEIPEAIVPGLPEFDPPRLSAGGVLLSWSAPANAAVARVVRYEVAAWLTARAEPPASADVEVAGRTDHTVTTIGSGCEFRARVRAVGAHGAGGYARLDPTVLGTGDCEAMRPTAPTAVRASLADRLATVRWTPGTGDIEVAGFEVEADPESGAGQSFTASVAAGATSWTSPTLLVGDWRFRVRADGRSLTSEWSAWSNTVKVGGAALATVSFVAEETSIFRAQQNPAVVVLSEPLDHEVRVDFYSPNRNLYVLQLMKDRPGYDGEGWAPYTVVFEPGRVRAVLHVEPADTRDPFIPGQYVDYQLASPEPGGDVALGHPSTLTCVVDQPQCFSATVPALPGYALYVLAGLLVLLGIRAANGRRRGGR